MLMLSLIHILRSLLNNSRLILWMLKQPHNFYYEKRKIMKPIIVDLKDISDSTEVYDSKPNRFVPYTIYIICAILTIALIWMYLFRMDIVVKADSVFRGCLLYTSLCVDVFLNEEHLKK